MLKSYRVAPDLFLNRLIPEAPTKLPTLVELPTNHIVVIDCSGSMSAELPQIRDQLKRKLPRLLGEEDTITIIWFSGADQYGVLIEGEPVAKLADLAAVNRAIDRWLRPNGMTGFTGPLREVRDVAGRLGRQRPGSTFSLFFMSDGGDNQSAGRAYILAAVRGAAELLAAATFVEYGFYADRALLAEMAARAGGNLIFAEAFDRYDPIFETAMKRRPRGRRRQEIILYGDQVGGIAWSLGEEEIITYVITGAIVSVAEGAGELWYLSAQKPSISDKGPDVEKFSTGRKADPVISAAYAALSLWAVRMKPEVVFPLLRALGDVRFIDSFAACFGKQRYTDFMEEARAAAFNPQARWVEGHDPTRVPSDDAFTLLDLLRLLADDPDNHVCLDHPAFSYQRIGRQRLDADETMTRDEMKEIEELTELMREERDPAAMKQLADRIAAITSTKREPLKFTPTAAPDGYPVDGLTFAESRPNVSIRVRKTGTVDIGKRCPIDGAVPSDFPTHITRNYAIIKDGLVNVAKLPCIVSNGTYAKLVDAGVPVDLFRPDIGRPSWLAVFDLAKLPIVNRRMVREVSAQRLFELEWIGWKVAGQAKVWDDHLKTLYPPERSRGLEDRYGAEAAAWLKEQGLTDGGFSPKVVTAPATDAYMGRELEVKIEGLGKLPSVKEAREKAEKARGPKGKPLVAGVKAMADEIELLGSRTFTRLNLVDEVARLKGRRRDILAELAQIKFAIIVGQVWFREFRSLDDCELTLDLDGKRLCRVELKEIEIQR